MKFDILELVKLTHNLSKIDGHNQIIKTNKGTIIINENDDLNKIINSLNSFSKYHIITDIKDDINLNGKVVAKFTLKKVKEIVLDHSGYYAIKEDEQCLVNQECWIDKTCLTNIDLKEYLNDKNGYAWHIDNLVIFDRPKELSEFIQSKRKNYEEPIVQKTPQSWCYIEVENND